MTTPKIPKKLPILNMAQQHHHAHHEHSHDQAPKGRKQETCIDNAEYFDEQAKQWDEKPGIMDLANNSVRAIQQRITLRSDMDVLDFGCGTGNVGLQLAPHVRSVVGVDTSEGMITVLKQKAETV